MSAFFQRLIELNAQTDQIVMIAAKTDLRHLMGRNAFYIDNLITKAAVDVRPSSAGISRPVNQPLSLNTCILARVSRMVHHRIGNLRIEILTMQHVAFQRVNSRPVTGNKISIQ